jgi:hypothetical protein
MLVVDPEQRATATEMLWHPYIIFLEETAAAAAAAESHPISATHKPIIPEATVPVPPSQEEGGANAVGSSSISAKDVERGRRSDVSANTKKIK